MEVDEAAEEVEEAEEPMEAEEGTAAPAGGGAAGDIDRQREMEQEAKEWHRWVYHSRR